MQQPRPYADILKRLRGAGLRPTRQRLALARLLYDGGNRHVTAESLHGEAVAAGVRVSLATIYNTLHQFTAARLLRELVVEGGRTYFDTNVAEHHHFLFEDSGELQDIPVDRLPMATLPEQPAGTEVTRVDVVIRLRRSGERTAEKPRRL